MKPKDLSALLNEPACAHNAKSKSGCAKPKPGATAGGCTFDGAQIAMLPIGDVAHIVHGSIACAGNSWDNRGTRSSGPRLYKIGMTTDLTEQDIIMGRGEKRLFHSIKQAVDSYQPAAVFVYNTCVPALAGDDVEAGCRAAEQRWGTPVIPIRESPIPIAPSSGSGRTKCIIIFRSNMLPNDHPRHQDRTSHHVTATTSAPPE